MTDQPGPQEPETSAPEPAEQRRPSATRPAAPQDSASARPATEPAGPSTEAVEPDAESTPSLDELERIAVPATVRRIPQYRAFAVTGVAAGLVLALVVLVVTTLALDSGAPGLLVGLVVVVLLAGLGAFTGLAIALALERRARR